jgi:hypothetical protein
MDDVKVHYNSDKPAQLNALAYAQGTDIHVAPGQEEHLPHEAWHVVQQKQGRVQPTMQLKGANVNDNEGLEKEADVMGNKTRIQYDAVSHLESATKPTVQLMKLITRKSTPIEVKTLDEINNEFIPSLYSSGFTRRIQYNSILSYLRDTDHADLLDNLSLSNVNEAISNSTMCLEFYSHSRRDVIRMIAEAYISKYVAGDIFQLNNPEAIKIGFPGWKQKLNAIINGYETIVNRAASDSRPTGLEWPDANNISHWTQGGNKGGKTAFVAHVDERKYLIALGSHRSSNTYGIEWRASRSGSFTENEVTLGT